MTDKIYFFPQRFLEVYGGTPWFINIVGQGNIKGFELRISGLKPVIFESEDKESEVKGFFYDMCKSNGLSPEQEAREQEVFNDELLGVIVSAKSVLKNSKQKVSGLTRKKLEHIESEEVDVLIPIANPLLIDKEKCLIVSTGDYRDIFSPFYHDTEEDDDEEDYD